MPKIATSITIDVGLFQKVKEKEINLSEWVNRKLKEELDELDVETSNVNKLHEIYSKAENKILEIRKIEREKEEKLTQELKELEQKRKEESKLTKKRVETEPLILQELTNAVEKNKDKVKDWNFMVSIVEKYKEAGIEIDVLSLKEYLEVMKII